MSLVRFKQFEEEERQLRPRAASLNNSALWLLMSQCAYTSTCGEVIDANFFLFCFRKPLKLDFIIGTIQPGQKPQKPLLLLERYFHIQEGEGS